MPAATVSESAAARIERAALYGQGMWSTDTLSVSIADLTATLIKEPERREIPVSCDEQLVVEHYSR